MDGKIGSLSWIPAGDCRRDFGLCDGGICLGLLSQWFEQGRPINERVCALSLVYSFSLLACKNVMGLLRILHIAQVARPNGKSFGT